MTILPTYNNNLLFAKSQVDDLLGIWVGDLETFTRFKKDLNNFGIMKWNINNL